MVTTATGIYKVGKFLLVDGPLKILKLIAEGWKNIFKLLGMGAGKLGEMMSSLAEDISPTPKKEPAAKTEAPKVEVTTEPDINIDNTVEAPEIPDVKVPEIKVPEIKEPTVKIPEIKEPKISIDAQPDRQIVFPEPRKIEDILGRAVARPKAPNYPLQVVKTPATQPTEREVKVGIKEVPITNKENLKYMMELKSSIVNKDNVQYLDKLGAPIDSQKNLQDFIDTAKNFKFIKEPEILMQPPQVQEVPPVEENPNLFPSPITSADQFKTIIPEMPKTQEEVVSSLGFVSQQLQGAQQESFRTAMQDALQSTSAGGETITPEEWVAIFMSALDRSQNLGKIAQNSDKTASPMNVGTRRNTY